MVTETQKIVEARTAVRQAEDAAKKSDKVQEAREALEKAIKEQQEVERKERQAVQDRELTTTYDQYQTHLRKLGEELKNINIDWVIKRESPTTLPHLTLLNQKGVDLRAQVEHPWSRGMGKKRMTLLIRFNWALPARRFPMKLDGTFNYVGAAKAVSEFLKAQKARADSEQRKGQRKADAKKLVEPLLAKYRLKDYDSPIKATYGEHVATGATTKKWVEYVPSEGHLFFELSAMEVTPEQADRLLNLLNALDLL